MTDTHSAHRYARGAAILSDAAVNFGIRINRAQQVEWECMIEVAYILDGILDGQEQSDERHTRYDSYVRAMFGSAEFQEQDGIVLEALHEQMLAWNSEKTTRIIDVTSKIKEISIAKRATESACELGHLALLEGIETARWLEIDAPETHVDYNIIKFNSWLRLLLQLGVVFDTSVDLAQDYANGLTKVLPTTKNRLEIATAGRQIIKPFISNTPYQQIFGLMKAASAVIDDSGKDGLPQIAPLVL